MERGGTCECHAADYLIGVPVVCNEKGRLVHLAYEMAKASLSACLASAECWTIEDWGGDQMFLDGIVGATRLLYRRGMDKADHYQRIPYLFARIDIPEIAGIALDQYDGAPKSSHNRVSIDVCDEEGMRQDVVDVRDRIGCSDRLKQLSSISGP